MTPGNLYEKCVSLGLCERASIDGRLLRNQSGRWVAEFQHDAVQVRQSEAEDLAAMSVMRALEQRGLLSTYARVHKINLKLLADFLIRHASAC